MSQAGLRSFSAKKAGLLVSLYLSIFVLPEIILGLELGSYFWFVLLGSLGFGVYAFRYGSHMIQFYFIFFTFTLLFGYFIQFWIGIRFIHGLSHPMRIDPRTAIVLLTHFIGLVVGAILYGRAGARKRTRATSASRYPSRTFVPVGLVFAVILILLGMQFGGAERMFALRAVAYGDDVSSLGIFAVYVAKAGVFLYVAFVVATARKPVHIVSSLGMLGLFVMALVIANPSNTARFISLTGAVLVCMVYLGETARSKHLLTVLVVSSYVAIILLPVTSLLRTGLDRITLQNAFSIFSGLELSSIQLLINGVNAAPWLPAGSYTLSGLLIIVPTTIFASKAPALGPTIAEMNSYVFANTAVPSFFTGYVDFGLLGAFLFSVVLGFIFQFVHICDNMNLLRRGDGYRAILLACTPIIARGDLSTAMISIYAYSVAYEVMHFGVKLRIVGPHSNPTT